MKLFFAFLLMVTVTEYGLALQKYYKECGEFFSTILILSTCFILYCSLF